jgi:hypothetical protein
VRQKRFDPEFGEHSLGLGAVFAVFVRIGDEGGNLRYHKERQMLVLLTFC